MLSQAQILPFALLFCVSDTIYPEVSAAEGFKTNLNTVLKADRLKPVV